MTLRRSSKSCSSAKHKRTSQSERRQRKLLRQLRIEGLEDRRMMALGPQLIGILPDDGSLLDPNETLNVAPLDLTFNFDEATQLDFSTVGGIRLWQSGYDGKFTPASVSSDFNTNNTVEITFAAKALGTTENGITIAVSSLDFGIPVGGIGTSIPRVTVVGKQVNIVLNTRTGFQSTAQDLVTAVNANLQASRLLTAEVTAGNEATNLGSRVVNYSPLTLTGANAASATTDLNTANAVRLKLTASVAGQAGNDTTLFLAKSNLGAGVLPTVTVGPAGSKTVNVVLNSTTGSQSKAIDLVNAINRNAAASAILKVTVIGGNSNANIANTVINGTAIRLTGSNDILVTPGFAGRGAFDREAILRFKETLPDDRYHIDVFGNGPLALKDTLGNPFNMGVNFQREFNLDLGAHVISVVPQPVDRAGSSLTQRRRDIDVYFNQDDLYPGPLTTGQFPTNPSVVNPAFYQLIFTRDTVQNTDDQIFLPTTISYDPDLDKAVLTFAAEIDKLPTGAGTYRLRIGTNESAPVAPLALRPSATVASDFNTAGAVNIRFDAVSPGEAGDDIAVIVSKANLGPSVAPTVTVFGKRITVVLNNSAGSLTTAQQLVDAINGNANAAALVRASIQPGGNAGADITSPAITYSPLTLQFTSGLGSSFDTSLNAGVLGTQSVIYTSAIDPQPFTLNFPGGNDDPGHRDINIPSELHTPDGSADTDAGITTLKYNFRSDYGFDAAANPLFNNITENQKQRAREIFQIISQVAGVNFVESATEGFTIATGDLRARTIPFCAVATGQGFPFSISGPAHIQGACGTPSSQIVVIMDNAEAWDDSYGGTWFQRAFHEIFHVLGLGDSFDLPPGNLQGQDGPVPTANPLTNVNSSLINPSNLQFDNTIEPSFPGAGDIVHLQHIFRPESKDIDMYKFQVTTAGLFTAETLAERRFESSALNSALRLWKEVDIRDAGGTVVGKSKELAAQNDDYFSKDSFLRLTLTPGTYWVGVSASGNDNYDPTIEDTGIGGKTQGEYDLRLNFRPNAVTTITDLGGVSLDGDANGTPGGATCTNVACAMLVRLRNEFMIPQTVPNSPIYGLTEPTVAKNDRCASR